jgi:hypothetical protein
MATSTVPIPQRMQRLPRDARGYPIPAGVFIDSAGTPQFTINNEAVRQKHIHEDRCSICGSKLIGGRWFVAGPRSAFLEHGAYYDPPMHDECVHYALKVCPYLAAPSYTKRIDMKRLGDRQVDAMFLVDTTQIPDRPEVFTAVLAYRTVLSLLYVKPSRPYIRVEFWRHGVRLDDTEGQAIVDRVMAAPIPARQPVQLYRAKGGKR